MDNKPEFKIHGFQRRKLKKELAELKSYAKSFWHLHQLDCDMASFYGGSEGFPMNDEVADKSYQEIKNKIEKLETILKEPYTE